MKELRLDLDNYKIILPLNSVLSVSKLGEDYILSIKEQELVKKDFYFNQLFCKQEDKEFEKDGVVHNLEEEINFESLSKILSNAGWFKTKKDLSIIILTKDNVHFLGDLLGSIKTSINNDINYEIVIVSNCEKVETIEYLKKNNLKVDQIIVITREPFSFARSCNLGARISRGKWLLFQNDDTQVTRNWASEMLDVFKSDPTVGVVGSKILFFDGKLQHMGIGFEMEGDYFSSHPFVGESRDLGYSNDFREMDAVTGACLMTPKDLFLKFDGFSEIFKGGYFEDSDYCFKVRKAGKKVVYCPKSIIFHHLGGTYREDFASSYFRNCEFFKSLWADTIENNLFKFVSPGFIYKRKPQLVLQDSFLNTAGGGEKVVLEIAETCKKDWFVKFAVYDTLNLERLKDNLFKIHNINFDYPVVRQKEDVDCHIYLNHEWFSGQSGLGRERNIYFVMFPHKSTSLDFLNSYDTIVANSLYTKYWIKKYWKRESEVIYPIVDSIRLRGIKKENIILGVGRYFPGEFNKQHKLLIKEFKNLNLDWKLIICGRLDDDFEENVNYFEDIKKEAEGDERIQVLVNLPRKNLIKIYNKSKIFWHAVGYNRNDPAQSEHFGIVVAEAQSAGVVPVVIKKGGLPEIVQHGENGYLWRTLTEWRDFTLGLVREPSMWQELSSNSTKNSERFGRRKFRREVRNLVWSK